MFFQTKKLSEDGSSTTCTIIDNSNNDRWIVEYNESGRMVKKEIHPDDILSLDYFPSEISN